MTFLKSSIFCWAGHTSGFLSQARLAECYLGAHQGCLAVEAWWTCIHWPIKHITCWPAWHSNPHFFEESAQLLIETTSSAFRCTWGTFSYYQFEYIYVATQCLTMCYCVCRCLSIVCWNLKSVMRPDEKDWTPASQRHDIQSFKIQSMQSTINCTQPPLLGWPICWCPHHKGSCM